MCIFYLQFDFQELKDFASCIRFNWDYYDKLGDSWSHNNLLFMGSDFPPPINVHNKTDISNRRWVMYGVRNPEESPDYTG